jgi:glutathione S-transferase
MPSTIQFFVFPKETDEPSGSGYCQKLETFFRICDFKDYEVKFTSPPKAPKGKLPYIVVDNKPVADSHFIIRYLIQNGKMRDLDAGLTPVQRAESRAWQAYAEELVYPAVGWTRFGYPENYAKLKEVAVGKAPWFVRTLVFPLIGKKVRKSLVGHGVGRHSREEVDGLIEEFANHLAERLLSPTSAGGGFFHGSEPTIIDCAIYGFLVNGLRMKDSNPGFTKAILAHEVLREYVARGTKLWFPEYKNFLEMVETGANGAKPEDGTGSQAKAENEK